MEKKPSNPHSSSSDGAQNYDQPVAYDANGQPLYARPQAQHQPQMVYVSRPAHPVAPQIPEAVKQKEAESRKKYPNLNLSRGEYVISAVRRHPIGVLQIWLAVFLIIGVFAAMFTMFVSMDGSPFVSFFGGRQEAESAALAIIAFVAFLTIMGGLAATYIYENNRFYLTNESVVQEIQHSLFAKDEQTVSLANIEDASFKQTNPLQLILNYGSIRLSTEGDETTYRFSYVANPKKHIATLNNAVEAFKNGRPVDPNEED